MPKQWYFKFDVQAYIRDTRALSNALRGFWMDVLCLMHDSPRRGYLLAANGMPLPLEHLARFTGESTAETSRALRELLTSGVLSITADGIHFNRRMVRETEISEVRGEAGRKGGFAKANPWQTGQQNDGKSVTVGISYSSSGEGGLGETPPEEPPGESPDEPPWFDDPRFRDAWAEWYAHRLHKRAKLTPEAMRRQRKRFAEWGLERSLAAMSHSIEQGYQGIFEPPSNGHKPDSGQADRVAAMVKARMKQ